MNFNKPFQMHHYTRSWTSFHYILQTHSHFLHLSSCCPVFSLSISFGFPNKSYINLVCLCPGCFNVLYCKILTLNDLDMVIKPRNAYKSFRLFYIIYLVFLLHVSSTLWPSSGRCSTKDIFKHFSNQCTSLKMYTSVAQ
jgi:hypothetical protein